ncbi:Calx-beta domain-containing protein [Fuerstiella marisgermanici]|uniref:Conjugal transfer protein n=1 Tax=Fuerstiella marisgermanici TaxID=1891926 RepID=A0A1P8W8S9_9PLAN|nr:Calx-beta domain-containing protein [Fuerstiella marisgermanici]APZ90438.1 conjugal transfer protein [Fuerstiella marisgermanici]
MSRRNFSAGLNRTTSTKSGIGESQRRAERARQKSERFEARRGFIQQKRQEEKKRHLSAFKRAGLAFRMWWLKLAGLLVSVVRPIVGKSPVQRGPVRRSNRPEQALVGTAARSAELLEPKALLAATISGSNDWDNTTLAGDTVGDKTPTFSFGTGAGDTHVDIAIVDGSSNVVHYESDVHIGNTVTPPGLADGTYTAHVVADNSALISDATTVIGASDASISFTISSNSPTYPPPGGSGFSATGDGIGKVSGRTFHYDFSANPHNDDLGDLTWGPAATSSYADTKFGLSGFSSAKLFTAADLNSLSGGEAIWQRTDIPFDSDGNFTSDSVLWGRLRVLSSTSSWVSARAGMENGLGAELPVVLNGSGVFPVTILFEVSSNSGSNWHAAIDYYDANSTGDGGVVTSFNSGFWTFDPTADVGGDLAVTIDDSDGFIDFSEQAAVGFTVAGLDSDATATVTFSDGTTTLPGISVTTNGSQTVDLSGLTDGLITATIVAADNGGSTATASDTSTKDTVAPIIAASQSQTIAEHSGNFNPAFLVNATEATTSLENWTITGGNHDTDGDLILPFSIDPLTGEITIIDADDLNFESRSSFPLTVTVDDSAGQTSAPETVTVSLTDITENVAIDAAVFTAGGGHVTVLKSPDAPTGDGLIHFQNASGVDIAPAHDPDKITSITITGRDGMDDLFVLDLDNLGSSGLDGVSISYDGGTGGNDILKVIGSGDDAVYTPDGTTFGDGVVAIAGGPTITFTGLEPVDITGMANVTITSPANAANAMVLNAGFDDATGAIPAIVVSGNTGLGGTMIEAAHLWNNTNVTIDTSATTISGADSITVASALTNAHANTNLTLQTTADGTVDIDAAVTVTGTLAVNAATVTLNDDLTATSGISGTADTVNVNGAASAASGSVQDGLDVAANNAVVNLDGSTFAEGIVISQGVTILGTFSIPNTSILQPTSGNAITISGTVATDDVTILGVDLDGTAGGAIGISVPAGDVQSVDFQLGDISGFSAYGVRVDAGATIPSGLVLDSVSVASNGQNGLAVFGTSGTPSTVPVTIQNSSTFTTNGGSGATNGDGDIVFFHHTGEVTLTDLTVTGYASAAPPAPAENGIQFRSDTGAIGLVSLSDVTISGFYEKVPLAFYNYDNVDNLTATGVAITAESTGFQLAVNFDGIGGDIDLSSLGIDTSGAMPATVALQGADGDNVLTGNDEPNDFFGGTGNDTITGNLEKDQAFYVGLRSDFTVGVTTDANGRVTGFTSVTDTDAGAPVGPLADEGADTLSGVEVLVFDAAGTPLVLDLTQGVQQFNSMGSLIGTFDTIQDAIDAAADGDTIRVFDDTYTEDLTVPSAANPTVQDLTLELEGTVDGTIAVTDDGTTIRAIGDLTMGDGSAAGFDHEGTLETGAFKVTLLDSSQALLGETTIVGAGGELEADNGVSLSSGETLKGEGTVDADVTLNSGTVAGNLTIEGHLDGSQAAGGTITPGNSPGITNTAQLTLSGADTLTIEVDGTAGAGVAGGHDQTVVDAALDGPGGGDGTVTLGGATLSLSSTGGLPANGVYTIIDNDGGDAVSGTFAGLAEGATVTVGGQDLVITYVGGDGNDVLLFTKNMAKIEFGDGGGIGGASTQSESGTGGTAPTILVEGGDLTGIPAQYRTVSFSVPSGSAQSGASDDYTLNATFEIPEGNYTSLTPFDLTLVDPAGLTSGDPGFTAPLLVINQDTLIEGTEDLSFDLDSIGVALENEDTSDPGGAKGEGTTHNITDDDFLRITIDSGQSQSEATTPFDVGLTIETSANGGPFGMGNATIVFGGEIEFDVVDATTVATGNAVDPDDYAYPSPDPTFTLPAGYSGGTVQVSIPLVNDSVVEGDELVALEIDNISSSITPGSSSDPLNSQVSVVNDSVTIEDDDVAVWNLTQTLNSVDESAGTQTHVISLNNGNGSTTAAVLQAGETAVVDFIVTSIDTERGATKDYAAVLAANIANWNTTESPAGINGTLSVNLSGTDPRTATITYLAGSDGLGGGANTSMPDLNMIFNINDDSLVEGDEDYTVELAAPMAGFSTTGADVSIDTGLTAPLTTTINDNETATWSIEQSAAQLANGVNEGDNATYTIKLTATGTSTSSPFAIQANEKVSVEIDGSDLGTDSNDYADTVAALNTAIGNYNGTGPGTYALSPSTTPNNIILTYTAGPTDSVPADLTVVIGATDDALVEGSESVKIELLVPGDPDNSTVTNVAGNGSSVTTAINDNETATWSIEQSAAQLANGVNEGDNATYTIKLTATGTSTSSPFAIQANEKVSVEIDGSDLGTDSNDYADTVAALNTAIGNYNGTGPGTYALSPSTTPNNIILTYTAGPTDSVPADLTVVIGATDDALVEGSESVKIELLVPGDPDNSTVTNVAGNGSSVTTAINDNETATWSIEQSAAQLANGVNEGDNATYTIKLTATGTSTSSPFAIQANEKVSVEIDGSDLGTDSNDYADTVAALNTAIGNYNGTGPGTYALSPSTTPNNIILTYTAGPTDSVPADLTVVIGATDDALVEGSESVKIELLVPGDPDNSTVTNVAGNGSSVTTAINDNETATWSIEQSAAQLANGVNEGDNATYTIKLTATGTSTSSPFAIQANEKVSVEIDGSDLGTDSNDYADTVAALNTAIGNYNGTGPGTYALSPSTTPNNIILTYTAGPTDSVPADLTVVIGATDDALVEGSESVKIELLVPGDPDNSTVTNVAGNGSSVTTAINDNETATWSIEQSAAQLANGVNEGDNATYTIKLTATGTSTSSPFAIQANEKVSVEIDGSDLGTDSNDYADTVAALNTAIGNYNGTGPGTYALSPSTTPNNIILTYTAGPTDSVPADLTVVIGATDDALVEGSESVKIELLVPGDPDNSTVTNVAGNGSSVTTAINDNETATWSIEQSAAQLANGVNEGDNATYTIKLTATGTSTSSPFAIQANEKVSVEIDGSDLGTDSNDYADTVAALNTAIGNYNGTGPGTYALSPSTTPNNIILTYTAGPTDSVPADLTVVIGATDDALVEGSESVKIELLVPGDPDNSTVTNVAGNGSSVTTAINDNETATWSIEQSAAQLANGVNEGDNATYTIKLTATGTSTSSPFAIQANEKVSVEIDGSDLGTDSNDYADTVAALNTAIGNYNGTGPGTYALSPSTTPNNIILTYTAGPTDSVPADLTVVIGATDDALVEGSESVKIELLVPGDPDNSTVTNVAGNGSSVTTAINDNETATWSIEQSAAQLANGVNEGDNATYTIKLTATGTSTSSPFAIQANEKVSVEIDGSDLGTDSNDYADTVAALNTAIGNYNGTGPGTYALSPSTTPNNIILTYTAGPTDSVPADLTVVIGAIHDTLVESSESVKIELLVPGDPDNSTVTNVAGNGSSVTTAINDIDEVEWSITQTSTNPLAEDTDDATFDIELTGVAPSTVLASGITAQITAILTDIDTTASDRQDLDAALQAAVDTYNGMNTPGTPNTFMLSGTTLTYTGDGLTAPTLSVTIDVVDDSIIELDEDFAINLTGPGTTSPPSPNISLASGAPVLFTIDSEDQGVLVIRPVENGDEEPSALTTPNSVFGEFEVRLEDGAGNLITSSTDTIVNYSTAGTATPTLDYSALTGTVNITAGSSIGTITVAVNDDNVVEATETVVVTLSSLGSDPPTQTADISIAALPDRKAEISILDNDHATLTVNNVTVNEADGTATVSVSVDKSVQGGFAVDVVTSDGTATDTSDYTGGTTTLNFSGGVGEVETFTIPIINDSDVEPDELFNLTLSNVVPVNPLLTPNNGAGPGADKIDSSDTATVTIANDDIDLTLSAIAPATQAEGDTGDTTQYTFTVTRTGLLTGTTTVDYAVTGSGATAADGTDFDGGLPAGTITFAPTETSKTITIDLAEDEIVEADEGFTVTLSNQADAPADSVDLVDSPQTATIENDDTANFTVDNVTVNEADGTATVTVTLNGAVQGGVSVDYATSDGSATDPGDYGATSGTLTFLGNDGETMTFSVGIVNDSVVEADEAFTVTLSNGDATDPNIDDNDITATDTATVTIANDDIDLTLSAIAPATQAEGDTGDTTQYTFTVTRTGLLTGTTTVDYAVTGSGATAADGTDFDGGLPAGTITFAPTETSKTITIDLAEDEIVEADEGFTVTLSNQADAPADSVDLVDSPQTATIENDDTANFTVDNVTVNEADGTATVTVTLNGAVQGGVSVDYATSDGSATDPGDYGATSGTLTFLGNDGETMTFSVGIVNDSVVEADEAFTVTLSNGDATDPNIDDNDITATDTATVTIANDDIDLTLSAIAPATQAEGDTGDTTQYTFTVTRTGLLTGTTTVDYAVTGSGATAADGTDFDGGLPAGTITFAPTETSKTITIDLAEDEIVEADEGFTVTLSNQADAPADSVDLVDSPQTATIENDDTANFTVDNVTVNEADGTATVTVTLNGAVQGGVSVDYATSDGSATDPGDYGATSGTLTFLGNDGETMTFSVGIVNDSVVEADEAFTVTLSNGDATDPNIDDNDITATDTATVTIANDDIDLTLSAIAPATQAEGDTGDTTQYTFTVTRTGLLTGTTTVDYAVTGSGATAADGTDFDGGLPAGTITFAPTETSKTITIDLAEDEIVEADEGFTVTLSNQADAPADSVDLVDSPQTATIENDDTANFTVDNVTVNEADGTATVTVTLNGAVQGGVSVDYATSDGSATDPGDYGATSGTLTFLGNDGETMTFSVGIVNDSVVEADEAFTVTLSNGDATDPNIDDNDITATDTATVTIANDDIDLTLSAIAPATQAEGDTGDTTQYTFTVTRTGLLTGTTTVDYAVTGSGATAADGTDFDGGLPAGTITFAPTETSKTITIDLAEDEIVEADEGFTVTLSNQADAPADSVDLVDSPQTATIENDDTANFTVDNVTVNEADGTATVTVTLNGAVQGGVSVDYATSDGSATDPGDYGATSGMLTFLGNDGETMTFSVGIVNDSVVEADEAFTVTLSNGDATDPNIDDNDITATDTATVTIANDDIDLTLAMATPASQAEGDSGTTDYTFEVTRDGLTNGTTTVDYAVTGSGANPADAADFGGTFPSGTVSFGVGETSKTITISVTGDATVEANEDFTVTLSNQADAGADTVDINNAAESATIENDDVVNFSINDVTVDEGDPGIPPPTVATFTVTLDKPADKPITVVVNTADGTATVADSDYTPRTGAAFNTLTFLPGQPLTQNFSVSVTRDLNVELDETFEVNLTDAAYDGVVGAPQVNLTTPNSDPQGIGTINNDDALIEFDQPGITLPSSSSEDGTGSGPVLIVHGDLTGTSDASRTVTMSITSGASPGFALEGFDFNFTGSIVIPAGNYASVLDGGTGNGVFDLTMFGANGLPASGSNPAVLDIINDNFIEGPEKFTIGGLGLGTAFEGGDVNMNAFLQFNANHVIDDNDTATISVVPGQTVTEEGGSQTVDIILNTDDGAGGSAILGPNVYFNVTVSDATTGTATVTTDYSFASQSVTFMPLDGDGKTLTVDLVPVSDTVVEAGETVGLDVDNLVNPFFSGLGTSQVTALNDDAVTILDNDTAAVSLNVASVSVNEDLGSIDVIVTLSGDVQDGFDVAYSFTDGTATGGIDYDNTAGSVTFGGTNGESQTITIPITVDSIVESDETFTVNLGTVTPAVTLTPPSAITASGSTEVTITNDDTTALTVDSVTVNEDLGTVDVVVILTNAVQGGFDVPYSFADVDTDGADFDHTTGTLSFAGTSGEPQTITIPITVDAIVEGDEDFTVSLGTAVPGNALVDAADIDTSDTGTVTIANDDTTILTVGSVTVNEDAGTVDVVVISSNDVQDGFAVPYSFGDVDTDGSDFDHTGGTLTFAGTAGESQTITIPITADTIVEGDEDFTVNLGTAAPVNALVDPSDIDTSDTGTVTITNDDAAALTIGTFAVNEDSGLVTVSVVLNNAVQDGFTVPYTLADVDTDGSDFDHTSGTLTFAGTVGETVTFSVPITIDAIVEGDEDFTVNLGTAAPVNALVDPSDIDTSDTGTVTITNDDAAALTIGTFAVNEDSGLVTVSVVLNNAVQDGFTVPYTLADVDTDGSDFDHTSGTLTFAGTVGETVTFSVPITIDAIVEGDEDFTVNLGTAAPVNALVDPSDIDTSDTGTVTITNDDSTALTVDSVTVNEDLGTVDVVVTLGNAVQDGFTVPYSLADVDTDGSDFDHTSGTLTFAGNAGETQAITVPITVDTIVEGDEDFTVNLGTAAPVNALVDPSDIDTSDTGTVTITNDDSTALTVDSVTVNEDLGTVDVVVTLTNAVQGGFDVPYSFADVDTDGADFDHTSGTLSFAGTAGEPQTITIPITVDAIVEGDEDFTVSLGTAVPGNALVDAADIDTSDTGTVTITNDDTTGLTVDSVTVNEDLGTVDVVVTLSNAVQDGFTVPYNFADVDTDGLDFDHTSGTRTFAGNAGETQAITVPITVDAIVEGDEDFTVSLGTAVPDNALVDPSDIDTSDTGTVTITNDDAATITIGDVTVNEQLGTVTLTATIDAQVAGGVTANVVLTPGTANAVDFSINTVSIWFPGSAANETASITVNITDDTIVEVDEQFTVGLDGVVGFGPITATDTATVTITDTDEAQVIITAVDADATEYNNTTGLFIISLVDPTDGVTPASFSGNLTVGYSISTTSALNAVDYSSIDGDVFFAGGATSIPVTITPLVDALVEGDETVTLGLVSKSTTTPGAPLSRVNIVPADQDVATVTIHDNDGAVTANDDGSFNVANGGTVTGSVLGNDTDVDLANALDLSLPADLLTASVLTGPANGSVTLNPDGTFSYTHNGSATLTDSFVYTATDSAGNTDTATVTFDIDVGVVPATVAGRSIFYNKSKFDGTPGGNDGPDDSSAIAIDKTALLPGQTANFVNYTSYTRGINGIMVDLANLAAPGAITAADFEFRVGNDNTFASPTWTSAPAPTSVNVLTGAGAGGSDRIVIVFADNAIEKQWLEVKVLANVNTGLATPDVHYWGNWAGESGNGSGLNTVVNTTDALNALNNPTTSTISADVDNNFDFNRDGVVNTTDAFTSILNSTTSTDFLRLISPPSSSVGLGGGFGGFSSLSSFGDDLFGDDDDDLFGSLYGV